MSEKNEGNDFKVVSRPFTVKPGRDLKVVVGGYLTIIAGALVISNGLSGFWSLHEAIGWSVYMCAVPITIMGVVGVLGGICALKDTHMSLSLAGAFLAAFGDGLPAFFLGVAALLLFFTSNRDI
ncbi:MAG: hypothetical protein JSV90_03650 [Methanobacteriota archaeon]|nr:MAG: hypothetical protein JSV90_03650 [Euryarchaeota archaeon]